MDSLLVNHDAFSISDQLQLEKLNQLLLLFSSILTASGFGGANAGDSSKRQVKFQRQLSLQSGLVDVVVQMDDTNNDWHAAVIEFRSLESDNPLQLNEMKIKRVVTQVSSSKDSAIQMANYRQLTMQIFLVHPISHQHEDFIYQIRVEPQPNPRILLGIPWIDPKMQLAAADAISVLSQISHRISPSSNLIK